MLCFLTIISILGANVLCSCSNTIASSPYDVIKETYGDNEYTISFNSENMDSPIDDLTYSAKSMPTLPIPTRVGYTFEGWYLDQKYTTPYVDGILYLYMSDITLYAKWSEISFETNGTYDIEFEASIEEDTIKKSSKTDEYGGYLDFCDAIIVDETYLEKTDDKLLLKIQYDAGRTTSYFSNVGWVFNVSISSLISSTVYIDNSINSLNDTVKTIFIDITDFDISNTIYLDVKTLNWDVDGLSDNERSETLTRYTVAFDITRIIGFGQIYADTSTTLDEGYYLAKSYYSYPNGSSSMGGSFNPVYSYIYSDGSGNYKLIKQNIPYNGLIVDSIGNLSSYSSYYSNRYMVFLPIQTAYQIDLSNYDTSIDYDYLPTAYNGGKYITTSIEFHASEGKAYNIFDLGSDLKSSYLLTCAVTGYMEVADAMGTYDQVLTIDYEHLIKLSSCDYEPLSGDAYEYGSSMQHYAGDLSDLNAKNLTYQSVLDNGISTQLINYFYTAYSATDTSKQLLDSKITITPTSATNAVNVSDSRYIIANFNVNTLVYGYDEMSTDKDLYVDSMTVQNFGDSGYREYTQIKTGMSCSLGEQLRVSEIYEDKINNSVDFSTVTWKAYKISDGSIDFSNKISLNSAFLFEEDIAIVFERQVDNYTYKTIVELIESQDYSANLVLIGDTPYDSSTTYMAGMTLYLPDIEYSWLGNSSNFVDYYYSSEDASINTVHFVYFTVEDSIYSLAYCGRTIQTIKLSGDETILMYEIINIYGEREYYTIEIDTSQKIRYEIQDDTQNIITNGTFKLDSNGERSSFSYSTDTEKITLNNALDTMSHNYYLYINDVKTSYTPSSYSIYSDSLEEYSVQITDSIIDVASEIYREIENSNYAFISIIYKHGDDTFTKTFAYNLMTTGGTSIDETLPYETYFVGYDYSIPRYKLYSTNGTYIAQATISIRKGTTSATIDYSSKYQWDFTFKEAGEYIICYKYYLSGSLIYQISTTTTVKTQYSDVSVTYVTDEKHPFDDGTTSITITYNLAEDIYTPTKKEYASLITDSLYGWILDESSDLRNTLLSGKAITDFVNTFNSDNVVLYAVWDPGITITYRAEGVDDITRTIYLSTTSARYAVEAKDYSSKAPSGKSFEGWTGGFLGDEIHSISVVTYYLTKSEIEWDNPDYFIIEAAFLQGYTVKYSIDSNYSDDFYRNETVLEGNHVNSPILKSSLSCKIDNYEFKGWYLYGDESKTIIDLELYEVYENITLVALFDLVEE